jgi:hypothetical protein
MSSIAPESQTLAGSQSLMHKIGSARSWPANLVAAAALLLFAVAWTLHGAIVESGKSLHYDLLEAYAWGQEFQLGYNQHGPFWAWIAGAWFLLFPKTNASFVLLEALNATLGLWGAWRLIGLFVKGWTRHAAALLLVATPFYTFLAFKYNANTILISLWPWTLFFFVRSLDNMSMRDAAWSGGFAAACILSKYYTAILLLTCALSLVFHPNGRRYLFSALPWIAAAIFSVLVLPHAIWALNADAPPVAYAMGLTGKGWAFAAQYAAPFLLNLVLYQGLAAGLIALAWLISRGRIAIEPCNPLPQSRRRFLAVLLLVPPVLTVIFGLAFQLKILPIMAVGIFPLMPLFLMQLAAPLDGWRSFQLAAAVAAAVTVLAVAEAPFERAALLRKAGPSVAEPRRELAARVTEIWHAETNKPLRYAGSMARYANGISFYSADHPSSLIDLTYAKSLWVTPEKIRQFGLLIACAQEDAECLGRAAGLLTGKWKKETIRIGRTAGASQTAPEAAFDIFIIPPQDG